MYLKYPLLKDIVLYDKGLFCHVSSTEKELKVTGMTAGYKTVSPADLDVGDMWNGKIISDKISSYLIK